jgi:XRE family transcriptional regulator, fatty acid utilization regulator
MKSLMGTRLRERRLALGRRQGDVARGAGISAAYLNLIEHNRRAVGGQVLIRLAGVLGLESDAVSDAAEGAMVADLRQAAAAVGVDPDEPLAFLARFPDWAEVVAAQGRQLAGLERAVAALNDRINHDPHLSATLHDLLSAATAVRAVADILDDPAPMDAGQRARFQHNLAEDSARLTRGAAALVAYLDQGAQADIAVTPQDEVMAWLGAQCWHLAAAERGEVDEAGIAGLATEAARVMARGLALQAVADAAAMPLAQVVGLDPDPVLVAQAFGVDVIAACRRIAGLPGAAVGLVTCDGAGAIVHRHEVPGFPLPRAGAGCTLWPLYAALSRPMQPVEMVVDTTGQPAQRFLLRAFCQTHLPQRFGGAERREAAMLILPAPAGVAAQATVGPTCRICPVAACGLRREPSILSGG